MSCSTLITAALAVTLPIIAAVKTHGDVLCAGSNAQGQCDPVADVSDLVDVQAGAGHVVGLSSLGGVVAWGANASGQSDVPPALDGLVITAVSAGAEHSAALGTDGSITCWGSNAQRQCNVPMPTFAPCQAVACGGFHTVAPAAPVVPVVCWGSDVYGQLWPSPAGSDFRLPFAAGLNHSVALDSCRRSVVAGGRIAFGESDVPARARRRDHGGGGKSGITLGSGPRESSTGRGRVGVQHLQSARRCLQALATEDGGGARCWLRAIRSHLMRPGWCIPGVTILPDQVAAVPNGLAIVETVSAGSGFFSMIAPPCARRAARVVCPGRLQR